MRFSWPSFRLPIEMLFSNSNLEMGIETSFGLKHFISWVSFAGALQQPAFVGLTFTWYLFMIKVHLGLV